MRLNRAPGLVDGIAVALTAALATAVALPLGISLLPVDLALRGLIALLSAGYVLYLLLRRRALAGAPTALAAWLIGALLIGALSASVGAALVAHLLLVWALRAALYHTRPLGMLADLGLCGTSLLLALWTVQRTHSLSAGVWCLLLCQVAFMWLPGVRGVQAAAAPGRGFEQAARAATHALRVLTRGIHR